MRLLLLLSAFLTAVVGSVAGAYPAAAQSYQAMARVGVAAPQSAEAIPDRRPATAQAKLTDTVVLARPGALWVLAPSAPLYAGRLRV